MVCCLGHRSSLEPYRGRLGCPMGEGYGGVIFIGIPNNDLNTGGPTWMSQELSKKVSKWGYNPNIRRV